VAIQSAIFPFWGGKGEDGVRTNLKGKQGETEDTIVNPPPLPVERTINQTTKVILISIETGSLLVSTKIDTACFQMWWAVVGTNAAGCRRPPGGAAVSNTEVFCHQESFFATFLVLQYCTGFARLV